jgi:hypothetical protein
VDCVQVPFASSICRVMKECALHLFICYPLSSLAPLIPEWSELRRRAALRSNQHIVLKIRVPGAGGNRGKSESDIRIDKTAR